MAPRSPEDSFCEFTRLNEFWIAGEASRLPDTVIGVRMVQRLGAQATLPCRQLPQEQLSSANGKEFVYKTLHGCGRISWSCAASPTSPSISLSIPCVHRQELLREHADAAMGDKFYMGFLD